MDSSLRYFGCAAGFGFGVLWMTEGLGAAILCLLLAGLGYGVVLVAERARANPDLLRLPARTPETGELSSTAEELNLDHGYVYEPSDDASSPLAADADYGWPVEQPAEQPVEQPELAHTNGR